VLKQSIFFRCGGTTKPSLTQRTEPSVNFLRAFHLVFMSIVVGDVLGMDVHLDISRCLTSRHESAGNQRPVLRASVWNHEGAK
jgi:hypothetical protein